MCAIRVLRTIRKAEYAELAALFFLQGAALGMWTVPLSTVLAAHGLNAIRPYAFATGALAAFVSPLLFGAMADRHASPVKVLRGLSIATAFTITLATSGIALGWNPWLVIGLIQMYAFCVSPAFSISSAIIFARLADAKREFGPLRAMATTGWMVGCCFISLIGADTSSWAGYSAGVLWILTAIFTYFLPKLETPKSAEKLSWHERMGLDALKLLKNSDHRVVFITVALFNIPLAGFYPYAPPHLRDLGLTHTTAWMSLGQVTEVFGMMYLGALLTKWRVKWILTCGLAIGLARFALSAFDTRIGLLVGIFLHGASFTLVQITAQIYLDQRVPAAWRARAQALLTLMISGVGNLLGYLGTGWWFLLCSHNGATRPWPQFWSGLTVAVAVVMAYFLWSYHGIGSGLFRSRKAAAAGDHATIPGDTL